MARISMEGLFLDPAFTLGSAFSVVFGINRLFELQHLGKPFEALLFGVFYLRQLEGLIAFLRRNGHLHIPAADASFYSLDTLVYFCK